VSDGSQHSARLRERLTTGTEDKLGKALADLLENPLVTGALGKAFDARERAAQAQELALGILNLPTASDIERLTRRLRSVSQRLEGIEDGVERIGRTLSDGRVEQRLAAVEEQLKTLSEKLVDKPSRRQPARTRAAASRTAARAKDAKATPTPRTSNASEASPGPGASDASEASPAAKAARAKDA
jgi:hypothetical protein